MLVVAILRKKGDSKQVISKLDDSSLEQAIELAKGAMANNRARAAYIYIKRQGTGDKPTLIKRLSRTWTGKVKIT